MKGKIYLVCKRLLLIAVVLALWKVASMHVNQLFVPDPVKVMSNLLVMVKNGQIFVAIWYSFRRIFVATVVASAVAIPTGLLVYNVSIARDVLKPIIDIMRYLPVTAFYPLLIMWFGIDDKMKEVFLFIAVFVYMMPSVVLALDEVQPSLIETGKTMGMSKSQIVTMIQLPATLPSIANSFIMMFGIGWTYIAVAETVNAKYGLGWIIQQSSSRGRTDMVFVGIIVIVIISILFDSLARFIVRRVFKWRYGND